MSGRSHSHRPNRGLQAYAALFMVFLYGPILIIPLFSFVDALYVRFPIEALTFRWYGELWRREPVIDALGNSLYVAAIVSVVSTAIGVFAAKAIARNRVPGTGAIVTFMMLPLVVPGIIFAVAILIVLNRMGVALSLYTVMAGHLVVCLPFAIWSLLPRFEGFDPSMEEASGDLGENGWWTFWRVTFPIMAPGIAASLLMTFTVSFDEFIMAFFLSGTQQTLPIFVWGQLRFPSQFPSILALSTLILAASFATVFLSLWIGRIGLPKAATGEIPK
ncbi:MAG: ABC transporter permease [Rhodobacterales bacterium]|nr:ABC transporter permease [Rhodobacterales bacterium]